MKISHDSKKVFFSQRIQAVSKGSNTTNASLDVNVNSILVETQTLAIEAAKKLKRELLANDDFTRLIKLYDPVAEECSSTLFLKTRILCLSAADRDVDSNLKYPIEVIKNYLRDFVNCIQKVTIDEQDIVNTAVSAFFTLAKKHAELLIHAASEGERSQSDSKRLKKTMKKFKTELGANNYFTEFMKLYDPISEECRSVLFLKTEALFRSAADKDVDPGLKYSVDTLKDYLTDFVNCVRNVTPEQYEIISKATSAFQQLAVKLVEPLIELSSGGERSPPASGPHIVKG